MGLEILIKNEMDYIVMSLAGRIDLSSNDYFIKKLGEVLLFDSPLIILDFSKVTFVSSTGIGTILEAKSCHVNHGSGFILAAVNQRIMKVFELIGVINNTDFAASVDDAVNLLQLNKSV